VLAVLLVLAAAGLVDRVRDGGHLARSALAEPPGQDREGVLAGATRCDIARVVLHGVVRQCRACHVGVGDALMAEDPDRNPQQVHVTPTSA
jgi:hypothetical protein